MPGDKISVSVVPEDQALEDLLEYLKRNRGFDFTGYKRASLMRRIQKRMETVAVENYSDYADYLEVHPEEFAQLFNTILINVTSFFRDPLVWEHVEKEVVPRILENKRRGEPVRVWSAGCASGEEAYTLAMLLAEAMGIDAFRERVKIYATDVDEEALNHARQASYSARDVQGLRPELLEKYFEVADSRYVFRKDLRRLVIFGRHDLVQDAPISRIDLLICRNALMYFNAEAQERILLRFHFALNEIGFLLLGRAEMLFAQNNIFSAVDLKRRIFAKLPRNNFRERFLMAQANPPLLEDGVGASYDQGRVRDAALDAGPVAQIVLDTQHTLLHANDRARLLCDINLRDLGRPFQDLQISYRPVELRSLLEQVGVERRVVHLREVEWPTTFGELRAFDIQVIPLLNGGEAILGVTITFTEVTRYRRLQQELEHANQELETAYEELQSTNEELETTNEELQSTVEELETTNEELQSTNEELETMNEELQSTNEELQTINEELRTRSDELNQVNMFLESILTSLRSGAAVLNRDLQVLVWNSCAEDMWGLRTDEAPGKHFLNLDIGLPVEQLLAPIRACLSGDQTDSEVVVDATNRRGRALQCRVHCAPLVNSQSEIRGVILLMDSLMQDG